MNKIYRHVWSKVHNALIPVPEIAGSVSSKTGMKQSSPRQKQGISVNSKTEKNNMAQLARALALLIAGVSPMALALPSGGHVQHGQASIHVQGNNLTVDQGTQKAIINWQKFGIKPNESVNFNQPNVSSITLNRVIGNNPSKIMGHLSANGQIFLVDPSGITFGSNASVDAGGIVASTLNITNKNFLNNNDQFQGNSTNSVINKGSIKTSQGGSVAFIGHKVNNQGQISTPRGTTALGAGQRVDLTFSNNHLLHFAVKQSALQASARNGGLIKANHGGTVILSAHAKNAALKTVVNNKGIIKAHSVQNQQGHIALLGGNSGTTRVSGTLDASANAKDASANISKINTSNQNPSQQVNGGTIETSGKHVQIANENQILTQGKNGGQNGTWTVDPTNFTIGSNASNSDITGTNLSSKLSSNNVTIKSSQGTNGSSGNIIVNAPVSWSHNKLTLSAYDNIIVNATMNVTSNGSLAFYYGQGSSNGNIKGTPATDQINSPVNLTSNISFTTKLGNKNAIKKYIVINKLGKLNSTNSNTLQGMDNNVSKNYVLGHNINAQPTGTNTSVWGTKGFKPIGLTSTNDVSGNFDGLGHAVKNLYINRSSFRTSNKNLYHSYVGLFSHVKGGVIKNTGVINANVNGGYNTGILIGYSADLVMNTYTTGRIKGKNFTGGLIGTNSYYADLYNSYANVKVRGKDDVGGLVGYNYTKIINSYATGSTSGTGVDVGGLVGTESGSHGFIKNSYATGGVSSLDKASTTGHAAGGLVGYANGIIMDSYATGNVQGTANVGGLIGSNYSKVFNSYATGSVSGNSNVGGLIGLMLGITASNDYATGKVNGNNSVGGLIGYQGCCKNCCNALSDLYWDKSHSSSNTSTIGKNRYPFGQVFTTTNVKGLTNIQMKQQSNYIGFDFANKKIWYIYNDDTKPLINYFLKPLTISGGPKSSFIYGKKVDQVLPYYAYSNPLALQSGHIKAQVGKATLANAQLINVGTYTTDFYSDQQGYRIAINNPNKVVIQPKQLIANILNNPTKIYNGTNNTTIASSNINLSGFVSGQGASASTQSVKGTYNQANAGNNIKLKAALSSNDFKANTNTLLSNYQIPNNTRGHFTGTGTIKPKQLTASFANAPSKIYNGNNKVTIASGHINLSGFAGNQGVQSKQLTGHFNQSNVGHNINVTANIGSTQFSPNSNTILSNYQIPNSVSGMGTIKPKSLLAHFSNTPTKTYNGTNKIAIASGHINLNGFVGNQGASASTKSVTGNFNQLNAGNNIKVSANINGSNFKANSNTSFNNYIVPNKVIGQGTIKPKQLTANILNNPTKIYNGTNNTTIVSGNINLSGFVGKQGASASTQSVKGIYNQTNVGNNIKMSADLNSSDFKFNSNTLLANYKIPSQTTNQTTSSSSLGHFTGTGTIQSKSLTANFANAPTKTYNGTNGTTILTGNINLNGFVGNQGAISKQVSGKYNQANAGKNIKVSANISSSNFKANSNTLLANYHLPNSVSGNGIIRPKQLIAHITSTPIKTYNGTNNIIIPSGTVSINGFVKNQGAFLKQVTGKLNQPNAGKNIKVSANLSSQDFKANSNTLLSNYKMPSRTTGTFSGTGKINPKQLSASIINNPTKIYNGTNTTTVPAGDTQLNGFVGKQGVTSKQISGTYSQSNAGSNIKITESLNSNDFSPNSNTLLINYNIPSVAYGRGTIKTKNLKTQTNQLNASIINNPTKIYNGNKIAIIPAGDTQLSGFVTNQGVQSKQINGTYSRANAGSNIKITEAINSNDFIPNNNTLLSNYNIPNVATGIGTIKPKQLTASITGKPTKIYNGNNNAVIPSGFTQLNGFVGNQGAKSKQVSGHYTQTNTGNNIAISANINNSNISPNSNTLLSNYIIPNSVSGIGIIKPKQLTANILNNPTKIYDGTNQTIISSGHINLSGFVGNQGASASTKSVTGIYNQASVGSNIKLSANLSNQDFKANTNTLLSNYNIPNQSTHNFMGTGTIQPKQLTASITGNPTKIYDGNANAIIKSGNISLNGLIDNQGATSKQISGAYAQSKPGQNITVMAFLNSNDFIPNNNTLLINYILPNSVQGQGTIKSNQSQKLKQNSAVNNASLLTNASSNNPINSQPSNSQTGVYKKSINSNGSSNTSHSSKSTKNKKLKQICIKQQNNGSISYQGIFPSSLHVINGGVNNPIEIGQQAINSHLGSLANSLEGIKINSGHSLCFKPKT